jgi:hypothetical protein
MTKKFTIISFEMPSKEGVSKHSIGHIGSFPVRPELEGEQTINKAMVFRGKLRLRCVIMATQEVICDGFIGKHLKYIPQL